MKKKKWTFFFFWKFFWGIFLKHFFCVLPKCQFVLCVFHVFYMWALYISAFFYVFIHKLMSFRNFEDCLCAISCMFSHFRPLLRIQKTVFHSHKRHENPKTVVCEFFVFVFWLFSCCLYKLSTVSGMPKAFRPLCLVYTLVTCTFYYVTRALAPITLCHNFKKLIRIYSKCVVRTRHKGLKALGIPESVLSLYKQQQKSQKTKKTKNSQTVLGFSGLFCEHWASRQSSKFLKDINLWIKT